MDFPVLGEMDFFQPKLFKPIYMDIPLLCGGLSRADGAFICLWLVFYSLEASG